MLAVGAPLNRTAAVWRHLAIDNEPPSCVIGRIRNDQCKVIPVGTERNVIQILLAAAHRAGASRGLLAVEDEARPTITLRRGFHVVADKKYMLTVRGEAELAARNIKPAHI